MSHPDGYNLASHIAATDPHEGYVLESVLQAIGDLLTASGVSVPARLPIGPNGHVLAVVNNTLTWMPLQVLLTTVINTRGDLIVGENSGAVHRLSVGDVGDILIPTPGIIGGLTWAAINLASILVYSYEFDKYYNSFYLGTI